MPFAGVYDSARGRTKSGAKADLAIAGIPCSMGTTGHGGQDLAPETIRRAMNWDADDLYDWRTGRKLDLRHVVDVGDVTVVGGDIAATADNAHVALLKWRENAKRFVVLGGDNLVSLWTVQALLQGRYEKVQLVVVDAHADTWLPEMVGGDHGSWIRQLDELGVLASVQHYGLRAFGGHYDFSCPFERPDGMPELRDDMPVYLALDIDGIDPAYAPGTGFTVPFGLSSSFVSDLVRYVMAHNSTVGMDITEVIPALDDRRGTTSQLAHMFVFDAIAAVS